MLDLEAWQVSVQLELQSGSRPLKEGGSITIVFQAL